MSFDLDAAFGLLEEESKVSSVLYYPKKGEKLVLALLPPLEYQGQEKLGLPIEAEFNGKVSKQIIIRFAMFGFTNDKVDYSKTQYVGIPLAPTFTSQLAKAHKEEYSLGVQECNLIVLEKADKTVISFKPKTVKLPDEVWQIGLTVPTWEELLEAHNNMKQNQANKKNGDKDKKADEKDLW